MQGYMGQGQAGHQDQPAGAEDFVREGPGLGEMGGRRRQAESRSA